LDFYIYIFSLKGTDAGQKLRPTSTMKSKDKSSKHRFGHVNATNPKSQLTFE